MAVVVKTIWTKSRMLPARGGREEGMLSVLWAHSQFGRPKPFRREHTTDTLNATKRCTLKWHVLCCMSK